MKVDSGAAGQKTKRRSKDCAIGKALNPNHAFIEVGSWPGDPVARPLCRSVVSFFSLSGSLLAPICEAAFLTVGRCEPMVAQHHIPMHADHKDWEQDIKTWQQDIDNWRLEQAMFMANAESALRTEEAWLKDHVDAVGRHEQSVLQHEHTISELDRKESADPKESTARGTTHRRETETHGNLQLTHERLKRHHHQAMAKFAALLHALGRGI